MNLRRLLTNTLLTAACLVGGGNFAWGATSFLTTWTGQVGTLSNDQEFYYATKKIKVAAGERYVYTLTNFNNKTNSEEWKNWLVEGNLGDKYFDCEARGNLWAVGGGPTPSYVGVIATTDVENWQTAYNGATVTITISRNAAGDQFTITHTSNVLGTTEGNTDKYYGGTFTVAVGAEEEWEIYLTQEYSHFEVTDVVYTEANGTTIHTFGAAIETLPFNRTWDTQTTAYPFDAGGVVSGTNITAFNANNTTATAWFDSDPNTEGVQPYTLVTDEEITISFTAYHGWSSGASNQGVKLVNSGGHTIAEYIYNLGNCNLTAVNIGESSATGWGQSYNCQSRYNTTSNANGFNGGSKNQAYQTTAGWNPVFTFKIRYDGYVTFNVNYPNHKDGSINNTYTGTLPDGWDVDIQKIQVYAGNYSDRSLAINNLSVSSEIAERHTVTFTYADTEDNSLTSCRANSSIDVAEGTSITSLITPDLTSSFYNGDESIRYDYADSYTVTGNATTVPESDITITLKFAPKAKYTYSINAIDGSDNPLGTITSVHAYAGEATSIAWSKYVNISDTWYKTDETTFTSAVTEGGSRNVVYSEADINYFFEFENLTKSGSFAAGSNSAERSNGEAYRFGKSSRSWTTALVAGTYTLTVCGKGENSRTPTLPLYICDSDGKNPFYIGEVPAAASHSSFGEKTMTVVVPEGKALCFYNNDTGNSNYYIDYVVLKRTGNAAVSATIGATGWSTFASPYALDLSSMTASTGEVKAYYASAVGDNSVTMTTTDAAIQAGEGIMLKGTPAATITIPVAASGSAIDGNKLVGVTTNTTITKETENYTNFYVLSNNNGTAEFQNLKNWLESKKSGSDTEYNTVTINAGKAYLDATGATGARLSIAFDDETTGVQELKNSKIDGLQSGDCYNLRGQRVSQPTKGLYIVNGKKVIMK